MFSTSEKQSISSSIQNILRATNHPELSKEEIQFNIHIDGAESWSWADIKNNGAYDGEEGNPWNEVHNSQ